MREALADKAGSGRGLYTVDRELLARLAPGAIVTQVRGGRARAIAARWAERRLLCCVSTAQVGWPVHASHCPQEHRPGGVHSAAGPTTARQPLLPQSLCEVCSVDFCQVRFWERLHAGA